MRSRALSLHQTGVFAGAGLGGYLAGEIDVEPFISHRLGLEEVNRGFELMEAQDGIRSVIDLR